MKVWLKLLLGSFLGIIIGVFLPAESQQVASVLQWLEKLAIGIGRYAVVPVLVFSLTMAVYKLRQEDNFWPLLLKNLVLIVSASVFVIFTGIVATLFFSPGRIPIERAELLEAIKLNPADNIIDLFPSNMFSVLAGSGVYLFPLCVFAFFLGLGLNYDRNFTKPVITMVDSLSRVFYHVASFFSEILGFIIIVLAAYWAFRFKVIWEIKVYRELILLLGVFSVVFCFGIVPLFLYILRPKVNPWRVLYGFLGPAIAAFFSGDINFTFPVLMRHLKENFGIKRRSSAFSLAICNAFCRGGSGMVAAAAFIVIIKSYTYLEITTLNALSIGFQAFVFSFILARRPGDGAFAALAALCINYGGGEYRSGYLILQPLAFYLVAVGTFIDITLSSFCSYIAARTSNLMVEKNIVNFI